MKILGKRTGSKTTSLLFFFRKKSALIIHESILWREKERNSPRPLSYNQSKDVLKLLFHTVGSSLVCFLTISPEDKVHPHLVLHSAKRNQTNITKRKERKEKQQQQKKNYQRPSQIADISSIIMSIPTQHRGSYQPVAHSLRFY